MITWIAAVAVFGTVMAGTPGPNNVLLAASGLRFGFARSLPFVAGIQAGLVVLIVLVDMALTFVSGLLAAAPIGGVWSRVLGIGVFVIVCVASCTVWLLFGAALRRHLADPARLRLVNRVLAVASAATAVLFWT